MARMSEGRMVGSGAGTGSAAVDDAGKTGHMLQARPSRRVACSSEVAFAFASPAALSSTTQIVSSAVSASAAFASRATKPPSITSSRAPLSCSR